MNRPPFKEKEIFVDSYNLIGGDNKLKRTMAIMATCSAWKKTRVRPHQALHLLWSYKQPRLLLWSVSSKMKRKSLPWVRNKGPESN